DKQELFLFTFNNDFYILSKDSLYHSQDGLNWASTKHMAEIKSLQLHSLSVNNRCYLAYQSGGGIFEVKGDSIFLINKNSEFRSFYGSTAFSSSNRICFFGGYGYFTFKNTIIMYD